MARNQCYEWLDAFKWTIKVFLVVGLASMGVVFILMNLAAGWKAAGALGALAVLTYHAAEFAGYSYANSKEDVLLRLDEEQRLLRKFVLERRAGLDARFRLLDFDTNLALGPAVTEMQRTWLFWNLASALRAICCETGKQDC